MSLTASMIVEILFWNQVLHGDELQADHWKIYPCEPWAGSLPYFRSWTGYNLGFNIKKLIGPKKGSAYLPDTHIKI